jgi:hypothetical protein
LCQVFCYSNKKLTNTNCLPALHGALQGGRERRQRTLCCSAAHPHSPTPGCSYSATSGLAAGPWCWVRRGAGFPQVQTRLPLIYSLWLSLVGRQGSRPLCRLWLCGSSYLPMPTLLPLGQGEQRSILEMQPPRKHRAVMAQLGTTAPRFPPPPPSHPRLSLRS